MEISPLITRALPLPAQSPSSIAVSRFEGEKRGLRSERPNPDAAAAGPVDLEFEQLQQVAKQFEALFIGMLMRSMRSTVMESDLFNPEGEGKYYRDWHDDELARRSAEQGGGFGVADLIVNQYAARLAARDAYGTEMASPPGEE
jgi:Rod binding domain-containing protein